MTNPHPWLKIDKNRVVICLHVQPSAKRNGVIGLYGDKLKIALSTPPVDGKANSALVKFLSQTLKVPKQNLEFLSGETSREKKISVVGCKPESIISKLNPQNLPNN